MVTMVVAVFGWVGRAGVGVGGPAHPDIGGGSMTILVMDAIIFARVLAVGGVDPWGKDLLVAGYRWHSSCV